MLPSTVATTDSSILLLIVLASSLRPSALAAFIVAVCWLMLSMKPVSNPTLSFVLKAFVLSCFISLLVFSVFVASTKSPISSIVSRLAIVSALTVPVGSDVIKPSSSEINLSVFLSEISP